MKAFPVPPALHEIFGETQTALEVALTVGVGVGAAACLGVGDGVGERILWSVSPWRAGVATVLVLDLAAGAVANLTAGTDAYYAARPALRRVFLAVHLHLPLIFWLLGGPLWVGVGSWAYAVATAAGVNALRDRAIHKPVAGAAVVLGMAAMLAMPHLPLFLQAASVLFLVKMTWSFAVDHRGPSAPGGQGALDHSP